MIDAATLEKLKEAYRLWDETKGGRTDMWLDLMAETVDMRSVDERAPGLGFAKDRKSRADVVGYFQDLFDEWEMLAWRPATFVTEGDHVAMFGTCAWRNKATGKIIDVKVANLWRFEDGAAVELTELFDSAAAAAGAMD